MAAWVWAVSPMSVPFAIGGMETSLFVLLLAATLYFHLKGQPTRSALSSGLSLVTGPDAALMALPVVVDRVRQLTGRPSDQGPHARLPLRELLALVGRLATWSIYAWSAYGSPLPHSVVAKAAAYHLPQEAALVRLLQHFSTPFIEHEVFGIGWIAVGLVLYPALFALGAFSAWRHTRGSWPGFAFPVLYFAAFSAANPLIFRWYLAPPLPFFFLGIFLGVERLGRDFRLSRWTWVFGAAAVALTLNAWTLVPDHGPGRPAPDMAYIGLELLYEEVGHSLQPRLLPEDVVAAGDIGVLGFVTRARILDLVGLVSPASAHYYPLPDSAYEINFAVSPDLIADMRPEYVVLLEVYGRRTLLRDPRFVSGYDLVDIFPTDIYGSRGMLVFRWAGP